MSPKVNVYLSYNYHPIHLNIINCFVWDQTYSWFYKFLFKNLTEIWGHHTYYKGTLYCCQDAHSVLACRQMKHINWNTEKSLKLKESRGIFFSKITKKRRNEEISPIINGLSGPAFRVASVLTNNDFDWKKNKITDLTETALWYILVIGYFNRKICLGAEGVVYKEEKCHNVKEEAAKYDPCSPASVIELLKEWSGWTDFGFSDEDICYYNLKAAGILRLKNLTKSEFTQKLWDGLAVNNKIMKGWTYEGNELTPPEKKDKTGQQKTGQEQGQPSHSNK